jgi:hypothetical protein
MYKNGRYAIVKRDASSLVGTTSNSAGAILRTRKALFVTRLAIGTSRLGCASGALVEDIALVDGVLLVALCWEY